MTTQTRRFNWFVNHGDSDGNNSFTIIHGDADDLDHVIVGCQDTEEEAVEACKRLNKILDSDADGGDFQVALQRLLNQCCMENGSNTPDFILAQYLMQTLKIFNASTIARDKWYSVQLKPGLTHEQKEIPYVDHRASGQGDTGSDRGYRFEHPGRVGSTEGDSGGPAEGKSPAGPA